MNHRKPIPVGHWQRSTRDGRVAIPPRNTSPPHRGFRLAKRICQATLLCLTAWIVSLLIWGQNACAMCKFREAVATQEIYTRTPPSDAFDRYGTWPTGERLPVCAEHYSDEQFIGPYHGLIIGYVPWPMYVAALMIAAMAFLFAVYE